MAHGRMGGMTQEQALASLQRLIDQQAHMLGANDIFFASALMPSCSQREGRNLRMR